MTRVYSRQSTGVASIKRQAPPNRSYNNRRGRRDFGDDSVQLGTKELLEDQIYEILNERIAHHLRARLGEAKVDLSPESYNPGSPATSSRAVALSIFSFATSYFDKFKKNHPLLSGEEARFQFATLIVSAIDEAIDEVLELIMGLTEFLDGEAVDSIYKFRELVSSILSDFVQDGPL